VFTRRTTIVCAVACATLAILPGAAALAASGHRTATSAALAQERYYSTYRPADAAALAQEQYYSSYGRQAPPVLSQPPATGGRTPWLPIMLALAAALVTAAAMRLHRLRVRRRRPAGMTS
jgi:hypothetical protein